MEFKTVYRGDTHLVHSSTNEDKSITVKVTRLRESGGEIHTISKTLNSDVTYSEAMESIMKIVRLDNDIFVMVAEHYLH